MSFRRRAFSYGAARAAQALSEKSQLQAELTALSARNEALEKVAVVMESIPSLLRCGVGKNAMRYVAEQAIAALAELKGTK